MNKRGRPRNFCRDQALSAAMRLFWEKGYEGASLAELANVMGINAPSLYAAFGDKESLFREAVAHYSSGIGATPLNALQEHAHVVNAIRAMLSASAEMCTDSETPRGCLVVLSAINCTPEHTVLRDELSNRRKIIRVAIEERLTRAEMEGELSCEVEVTTLSEFYTVILNGLSLRARDGATRDELMATIEHAMVAIETCIKAMENR